MKDKYTMISAVIIKGEANSERKSCYYCYFCKAAVTWWCTNKEVQEFRGTNIPGTVECSFWKPCLRISELSVSDRLSGSYIYIEC